MDSQKKISLIKVLVKGAMAIFYFGKLIALVDDKGLIVWRDEHYPIMLVDYLIEHPAPQSRWN